MHEPRSELFQFMMERSAEEAYLVRPDGRIVWANAAAAQSLGYTPEELTALRLGDVDPDYGRRFAEHHQELKQGKVPQTFETVHVTKHGRRLVKEVRSVALVFEGEDFVCGFARDVTARKQTEAALRQVTGLYALLSAVNHAVVRLKDRQALFDRICQVATENGHFRMAWVGLVGEDRAVRPVAQAGEMANYLEGIVITADQLETSQGPTGVAIREGRLDVTSDIAVDPRMAPWRERALARGFRASAAVPLRCCGAVVGCLSLYASEPGFFTPEECRLLEEVGEDVSFALDALESDAQRRALGAKLAQARPLEFVGRMAGGVAHDFNNLLMVVLSGVDLARREGGLPGSLLEVLDDVHDAAERSAELTRRLLGLARGQQAAPRVVNLLEAVERARRLLKRLAGEGVRVEFCAGPACDVRVDPAHLDQVLTNLVVNARDALAATAPADAVVSLSTGVVELPAAEAKSRGLAPGRWATLIVADNGPGLSREARAHLFEPFFTTKPEGKGTGLGLATVLALVRQAEGDVTVESEPGRGARFTVWLPEAR